MKIYCANPACDKLVIDLANGSNIRNGCVTYCMVCEKKNQESLRQYRNMLGQQFLDSLYQPNAFDDVFGEIFNFKKK